MLKVGQIYESICGAKSIKIESILNDGMVSIIMKDPEFHFAPGMIFLFKKNRLIALLSKNYKIKKIVCKNKDH